MSKLTMGFRLILVLMFFTGIKVEANPVNRCMGMMTFHENVEDFLKMQEAEQLNLFCTNATGFFNCMNDVLSEKTGLTVREIANHWLVKGTESGNYLNSLVELEDYVKKICRNGPKIYTGDLMVEFPCFQQGHFKLIPVKHCSGRSLIDYALFTEELPPQIKLSEADNKCIVTAYHLGCVGATVYEKCGVESFNRFKTSIKEIGFFRSDICSSDLKHTLKATLLRSFDRSETRKNVYRAILDLRRRRK